MKRILFLFVAAGMTFLAGCEGPQGPPGMQGPQGPPGTGSGSAEVYEIFDIDFVNTQDGYVYYEQLNPQLLLEDSVLMYRLSGTINSQTPIWQLIPRTLYLQQGELDYDYDFSLEDFTIYAGGTYNLALTPSYINNQTFRIVIIPGYFSRTTSAVDFNDYDAVIKAYGLEGKPVQRLNK